MEGMEDLQKGTREGASESAPLFAPDKPSGRDRAASRRVTVEPVVLLVYTGFIVVFILRVQYVLFRVQEKFHYTEHAGPACANRSGNASRRELEAEIQAEAAAWLLVFTLVGSVPGFVTAFVLGCLSDHLGRKAVLIAGTVGCALFCAICTAVMALALPLQVLYAADLAVGLTGGVTIVFSVSYTYIADVTTEGERIFRILVIETAIGAYGLAQVGMEYFLEAFGYAASAGCMTGLCVLGLVYLIWPGAVVETRERDTAGVLGARDYLWRSLVGLVRVVYSPGRSVGRTWRLALIFAACFMLTPFVSSLSVTVLYIKASPFCFSSVQIGYFTALRAAMMIVGTLVSYKVLERCFSHHWLFQIGCLFTVMACLALGLVRTALQAFLVVPLLFPYGLMFPVIRFYLSTSFGPDEQGAAFSFFACVENIGLYLSPSILNLIYINVVLYNPPIIMFVLAGFTAVASLLVGVYHAVSKRDDTSASE